MATREAWKFRHHKQRPVFRRMISPAGANECFLWKDETAVRPWKNCLFRRSAQRLRSAGVNRMLPSTALADTAGDLFVQWPMLQARLRRRSAASARSGNKQAGAKAPPLLLLLLTLRPFATTTAIGGFGAVPEGLVAPLTGKLPISVKPLDSDLVAKISGAKLATPSLLTVAELR
jgi:hypothetical protein